MEQLGAYVRETGNIGEGIAFDLCIGFSGGEHSTVLVLGGSLYFWADLLLAGRNVVFVYRERNTLQYVRRQLEQLLSNKKMVDSQFRTVLRPLESDMRDLIPQASVIAVVGLLHHMADPRAMLSQLLGAGKPLVVLDTTSEIMHEATAREKHLHGLAHSAHMTCQEAATNVGFDTKKDIVKLWEGERAIRWPQVFEYAVTQGWLAAWEGT